MDESLNKTLNTNLFKGFYLSSVSIRKPALVCASLFSLVPPSSRFEKHVSSLAVIRGVFFIHQKRQTELRERERE